MAIQGDLKAVVLLMAAAKIPDEWLLGVGGPTESHFLCRAGGARELHSTFMKMHILLISATFIILLIIVSHRPRGRVTINIVNINFRNISFRQTPAGTSLAGSAGALLLFLDEAALLTHLGRDLHLGVLLRGMVELDLAAALGVLHDGGLGIELALALGTRVRLG